MLVFDEDSEPLRALALHYAKILNAPELCAFLASEKDLTDKEQAQEIADLFWDMVDISVDDYHNNVTVAGIDDLETAMFKLMNMFIGYFNKKGFYAQWCSVNSL